MPAQLVKRLILALLPTLVAFCDGSTRSNLASMDSLSNTADREIGRYKRRNMITFQRQDPETNEHRSIPRYLSNTRSEASPERLSDKRERHETENGKYYSKNHDDNTERKRTENILDQPESRKTKKDWYNMTDLRGITKYIKLDKMAEQRGNSKTKYGMYNWIGSGSLMTGIKLGRIYSQHVIVTKEDRHRYNWTAWDGVKGDLKLDRILDQQKRLETIEDWYNWIDIDDTKRDIKLKKSSKDRQVRQTMNIEYESNIPDGFKHLYVPCSSIANSIILRVIQPKHMLFLQQSRSVSECLRDKLKRLDVLSIQRCFGDLTGEIIVPRWLMHLLGFVVVCGIIVLIALFMLCLCPCLMCWRISFRRIVQAGKLDTYQHVSWALITIFSCLSMLFALFGVITVGCAGIGLGYYLYSEQATQIYATYEEIQAIVLDARNAERHLHLRETNKMNVCCLYYYLV